MIAEQPKARPVSSTAAGSALGRVVVVDDDTVWVEILERFARSVRLELTHYALPTEFLEQFEPRPPECIVLDVTLPGMSGLELQRRVYERWGRVPMIFVSSYAEIDMAVKAMKQGAHDYVVKPCEPATLQERIHSSIESSRRIQRRSALRADAVDRLDVLTARQREVFDLVVMGYPSKKIAGALHITKKTVDVHRAQIGRKLEAGSITDLVRLAMLADSDAVHS